jgi:CelD/BcsL family acetyltransferase involved in cellulose biosynthesis
MTVAPPAEPPKKLGLTGRVVPATQLGGKESQAWEEIRAASNSLSSPFLSYHYVHAVAKVRPHVFVCVLTRGSRIAGFLPFQFRNAWHRALKTAERVGEEMTDYFGLIAEPGFRTDVQELLRLAHLNSLYFTHLDQSQLDFGLEGEKPDIGLLLELGDGPHYWAKIRQADRKFGGETERLERQVQREYGPFRFTFDEQDWREGLARIIQFKGEQYKRTGRPNLFTATWRARLVKTLAASREPACSGVLSTLYAGDHWIASHFGIRSGEVLQYWFPVYNPAMKRYAPGRLLFKQVMEGAPKAGIRTIDRGSGDNQAKRQLSNAEHFFYRGLWYRPGPASMPGRAALSLGWRLSNPPWRSSQS